MADKKISVNAPDIGPVQFAEGDWTAIYNVRTFIEKLLTANPNVKVVGAGCGGECADLDIDIEGFPFNILIRPREKP